MEVIMNKEIVLTAMLAVFVLVSAVQAFQLADLNGQIEGMSLTAGSSQDDSSASLSDSGGRASLPSSLESLPGMVGGC